MLWMQPKEIPKKRQKKLKIDISPENMDGPQTLEKLFSIANYQRKADQNYNEVPCHASKNNQTNGREGVKKREPSYTVGGDVCQCNHCREQCGGSLNN